MYDFWFFKNIRNTGAHELKTLFEKNVHILETSGSSTTPKNKKTKERTSNV
jgi:hypothetical protein